MKHKHNVYLGFDLGASSGRAILGILENKKLSLKEIHRFPNEHIRLHGTWYWDFILLWKGVLESLRICSQKGYKKLDGIGIDTWGVDFGLLGPDGKLVGFPVCYRDDCTLGIEKLIDSEMGAEKIFKITGLSPRRVASLSQLIPMSRSSSSYKLKTAKTFLMMPDLFRYFLGGRISAELTDASSSQLVDIHTKKWSKAIFKKFGLPLKIMPALIQPGTITGHLKDEIASSCDQAKAPLVAVAGHDTASAEAGVPFADKETVFISCGTWSVIGQTLKKPITTTEAFKAGFINELGFGSVLFVKNLIGLYLFENYHRSLVQNGVNISYEQMVFMAEKARQFKFMLDINNPTFFVTTAPDICVKEFLKKSRQKTGITRGELIRSLLESLAFSYRRSIEDLVKITNNRIKRICIIGGGIKNKLLCQMTADACGIEVLAGPEEAAIAANLAIQAYAAGQLKKPQEIRALIRRSFKIERYKPNNTEIWTQNYNRYRKTAELS